MSRIASRPSNWSSSSLSASSTILISTWEPLSHLNLSCMLPSCSHCHSKLHTLKLPFSNISSLFWWQNPSILWLICFLFLLINFFVNLPYVSKLLIINNSLLLNIELLSLIDENFFTNLDMQLIWFWIESSATWWALLHILLFRISIHIHIVLTFESTSRNW